ncbi:hypothetical protein F0562_024893 [Nyssa sinensis]|uniref:Uncharacterized protein n=1 Tax=Nyssa sinensis TaxID=561372 RepID=A0A5J5BE16_9ASTE|nr:hypothetical protein F0562_024893 [Nyssa sinensis]
MSAQDMDLETVNASEQTHADSEEAVIGDQNSKRAREEGAESEEDENGGAKKPSVEKSVDEQHSEKQDGSEADGGDKDSGRVSLGPKSFGSSVAMFDYFYKLLHFWTPNLNINKYEYLVLLDLLKKGHMEPEEKIGKGIHAFQVRFHPQFKSRCFFLLRDDESVDDFSFRKCVDHILPLPEDMKVKVDVNKALGGGGRGGHVGKSGGGGRGGGRSHGYGRGRGRGGKWRN